MKADNVGSAPLRKANAKNKYLACMKDNKTSHGGLPSSPMDTELSSSCPKYWGMKRRTFITQLASKLKELASLSPVKQHRNSHKCRTHIIISQRCNVIPNFAHLTESQTMQILQKTAPLTSIWGDHFPFSNDSCRRTSSAYLASCC